MNVALPVARLPRLPALRIMATKQPAALNKGVLMLLETIASPREILLVIRTYATLPRAQRTSTCRAEPAKPVLLGRDPQAITPPMVTPRVTYPSAQRTSTCRVEPAKPVMPERRDPQAIIPPVEIPSAVPCTGSLTRHARPRVRSAPERTNNSRQTRPSYAPTTGALPTTAAKISRQRRVRTLSTTQADCAPA